MADSKKTGHRQRLRERFLAGDESSRSEEALLELLLTYAIPQRDVQPLAKHLLEAFGGLPGVLGATPVALCKEDGIKETSAVLLKLVDAMRNNDAPRVAKPEAPTEQAKPQVELFEIEAVPAKPSGEKATPPSPEKQRVDEQVPKSKTKPKRQAKPAPGRRTGTGLFAKACLGDAIKHLPHIPDTDSLEEAKEYLRANLHYSAEQTRQRYTTYVTLRMFPQGVVDREFRQFVRHFAGKRDVQDVCFYRFMKAEPLTAQVVEELLIPAVGNGQIKRDRLREYLKSRYPESKSIKDSAQALVEALTSGGVVKADRTKLTFGYRDIPPAAFAFVLHSEFPEPGMYDLAKVEANPSIRAMLWNPNEIRRSLYELRNQGVISKVSEIDSVRQFTTKYTLAGAVDHILAGGAQA